MCCGQRNVHGVSRGSACCDTPSEDIICLHRERRHGVHGGQSATVQNNIGAVACAERTNTSNGTNSAFTDFGGVSVGLDRGVPALRDDVRG